MSDEAFTLHLTERFDKAYFAEFEYSKENFGLIHADKFFDEIDEVVQSIKAFPYLCQARNEGSAFRLLNHPKGIHILYHIDEAKRVVTLVDMCGDSRCHTLQSESIRRKTLRGIR